MPNLVEHQLRVAGVAMQICDAFENAGLNVDKDNVVKACLLHDMGNIIKFKLDYFPEHLEPEGLSYWQNIQNEYIEKYGKDEHHATLSIVRELNSSEEIFNLINSIGFLQASKNSESKDFSLKICCYADMRVSPSGVTSLDARLSDLRKRYGNDRVEDRSVNYVNRPSVATEEMRQVFESSLFEIEKQIFNNLNIKPEDITEESVKRYFDYLKTVQI